METIRGLIFTFAGGVLALVGVIQFSSAWALGRDGARASGEIIALNAGPAHPQVRFTTAKGETIEYGQGGFVNQSVGNAVQVIYDPANPRDAVLDTFAARYGFALLTVFGALIFIGVGAQSFINARRRQPGQ